MALASVITPKGASAIASIQVLGDGSEEILRDIFRSRDGGSYELIEGKIVCGVIFDGDDVIDDVVVGCEGKNSFVISCHGNAIIIEMIMKLLKKKGVSIVGAERIVSEGLSGLNSIAREVKIEQAKAVSLEGVRIINRQFGGGLSKAVNGLIAGLDRFPLEEIRSQSGEVLEAGRKAKVYISGSRVVIAGAPNSGKSTLLNCFCGKEKAIVTEHAGTTRDWVSGKCRVRGLSVEFVDTAGLDDGLKSESIIDQEAQKRSMELLDNCGLVLLVVDSSDASKCSGFAQIKGCAAKVLVVLNKSDLKGDFAGGCLRFEADGVVYISAKCEDGIEELGETIYDLLTEGAVEENEAVCFTGRQEGILKQLNKVNSKQEAKLLLEELLNGEVYV